MHKQHAALGLAAALTLTCLAAPAAHADDSNSGSGTRQVIYLGAALGLGLLALNDIDRRNEIGAVAFGAGTLAALWAFGQERRNNRGDEVEAATEAYIRRREAAYVAARGSSASPADAGAVRPLSLREPARWDWSPVSSAPAERGLRRDLSPLLSRPARPEAFKMTYAGGTE